MKSKKKVVFNRKSCVLVLTGAFWWCYSKTKNLHESIERGEDSLYQELKGIIVAQGKKYPDCAEHIGLSVTAFSNKINGKSAFKVHEAARLSDYLNMPKERSREIFLS